MSSVLRSSFLWHVLLIVAVSVVYESRFIHHWLNIVDEGWGLYAAMRLHQGGTLYRDAFFVFPPGHVLVPWIAYGLDPPGVVLARTLYAAFNVGLCVAVYALGRRLMSPGYALLGALLLALAAPLSHRAQLLFGYRYLVFSVLALLAYSRRLETSHSRWMLAAGCAAGVGLCFRLTPAFAVSVGLGVGVLAGSRDWRSWLRDGACYLAGVSAIALPVLAWYASDVGLATLWREIVVRAVVMTELQGLPLPELSLPATGDRDAIHDAFVALLFRGVPLFYSVYAVALGLRWVRALARREPFDQPLLVAVVVWGAVYSLRAFGRADEPHLSSAIPPFCLLLAHALELSFRWLRARRRWSARRSRALSAAAASALLAAWVLLPGADRPFDPEYRGATPLAPLDGDILLRAGDWWHRLGPKLAAIRELTQSGDQILDLSAAPMFYVLAGRLGPGFRDIVMPGSFIDEAEEHAFLARLERSPPALIIMGAMPFDKMESRSLARIAPRVMEWIGSRYAPVGQPEDWLLLVPRERRSFGTSSTGAGSKPGARGDAGPEQDTPSNDTPGEFWRSDAAQLRSGLGLEALDPTRLPDRSFLALMHDLDTHQTIDLILEAQGLATPLLWGSDVGSFAHPDLGVGIDLRLRRARERAPAREALPDGVPLVLAHQQAHTLQFRVYTLETLAEPSNWRRLEAQADLLAAMALTQLRMLKRHRLPERRPWRGFRDQLDRGLRLFDHLGHPWSPSPGLSNEERRRLMRAGVEAGILYTHAWTCITTLGEPENRRVLKAALRLAREAPQVVDRIFRARPRAAPGFGARDPRLELPSLDPGTCEIEDVFDWTSRTAATLLGD